MYGFIPEFIVEKPLLIEAKDLGKAMAKSSALLIPSDIYNASTYSVLDKIGLIVDVKLSH